MADYLYADDGKIHTRYTELSRCTAGQIDRVIDERLGTRESFKSDNMEFGTDRHDMWENEGKRTGRIPECFGLDWPISHVEQEFVSEILPDVVLHSRPDAVCADISTIVDYKTLIADSFAMGELLAVQRYSKSKQLPIYAYQAGLHDIRIKRIAYLVEIWNRQQTEILGYKIITKEFKMKDIGAALPWVRERVAMLVSAIEGRSL